VGEGHLTKAPEKGGLERRRGRERSHLTKAAEKNEKKSSFAASTMPSGM
jgi:hypothetical protein